MITNPYTPSEPLLQTLLSDEMYQRIHALALRRAVGGYAPFTIPESIQIERFKQQVKRKGPDICLRHPEDVARIFIGVTLSIYRAIEMLYCSHVGRSIPTVWRILTAMAQSIGVVPVDYEAVWAICVYLEHQRRVSVAVSVERDQEDWWLGKITLDQNTDEDELTLSVFCVVDIPKSRVLSFRHATQDTVEQQASLALYDALLSLRRPHQKALTGVLWHLPKRVITQVPLTSDGESTCKKLGISIDDASVQFPFLQILQATWTDVLAGRALQPTQYTLLFDRTLDKNFGYGPLRIQAQHDQEYAHLAGYTQDPDWLFPLLRAFLPASPGSISHEGCIEYDNLHYTDDLLLFLSGHPVTIRRPVGSEAYLWVYLDKDILCRAMARELRRRDGTYRRSRQGR